MLVMVRRAVERVSWWVDEGRSEEGRRRGEVQRDSVRLERSEWRDRGELMERRRMRDAIMT